jgi:hypothetical protein
VAAVFTEFSLDIVYSYSIIAPSSGGLSQSRKLLSLDGEGFIPLVPPCGIRLPFGIAQTITSRLEKVISGQRPAQLFPHPGE